MGKLLYFFFSWFHLIRGGTGRSQYIHDIVLLPSQHFAFYIYSLYTVLNSTGVLRYILGGSGGGGAGLVCTLAEY